MITDDLLLAVVPPAMERARQGPDAWDEARRDLIAIFDAQAEVGAHYRACVIAHYIGFLSAADPPEQLRWSYTALDHADQATPQEVASFMPSLMSSVGAALRAQGQNLEALRWYERAADHLGALEPGLYGDRLCAQIEAAITALRDE